MAWHCNTNSDMRFALLMACTRFIHHRVHSASEPTPLPVSSLPARSACTKGFPPTSRSYRNTLSDGYILTRLTQAKVRIDSVVLGGGSW